MEPFLYVCNREEALAIRNKTRANRRGRCKHGRGGPGNHTESVETKLNDEKGRLLKNCERVNYVKEDEERKEGGRGRETGRKMRKEKSQTEREQREKDSEKEGSL